MPCLKANASGLTIGKFAENADSAAPFDMTSYLGDEYDRLGCRALLDVTPHGYRLSIFAPNGAWMESYRAVSDPDIASQMLNDWIRGKKPNPYPADREASRDPGRSPAPTDNS
jgi:hypothetical protein